MPDLDLVRETYASLPAEKLLQLAREEKTELTDGAYQILEEEFRRRGLDIHNLPPEEKEELPAGEITEFPEEPPRAEQERSAISYLERKMIRANWIMFLFCILLGIGVLLMMDKMIREGRRETPIFAFVMIFMGLVGFVAVLYRKRLYKKQEMKFDFEKEKMDDEKKAV